MTVFKRGQRWISRMEPELGLGTLSSVENNGRKVCIQFKASGLMRLYSMASAPLERASFSPGDRVSLKDDTTLTVEAVETVNGLFQYHGEGRIVSEEMLSDTLSFSSPRERLAAGLFDAVKTFDLRFQALTFRHRYRHSPVMGFLGGRVELIPHQFYIAGEVVSRYLPRILLADETGLGKTIEASLILHRLLLSERITRVLILVPDALVHQWFVEMYRRFNLSFFIVNDDFMASIRKSNHLFLDNQLYICPIHHMEKSACLRSRAMDAGWDMVVVDEAHHVDPQGGTHQFLLHIGRGTTGMLLLTATPEQLGPARHFAHLKLLDPHRYTTLAAYQKEAAVYEKTVEEIRRRLEKQADTGRVPDNALEMQLDCYGPGRSIFRNTRAVVKGFPGRRGQLYPLAADQNQGAWLARLIQGLKKEKVLVICGTKERASALGDALLEIMNLKLTLFDETMTLLQRDRSAAWFSEKEGARLMICSEIGSEGRNFQFCHHLVLFDLPRNPELLEQRIGRLDRIGQTRDIHIHVPFVENSSQEVLARWYQKGTGIFEGHVSGLYQIHETFSAQLHQFCTPCEEGKPLDRKGLDRLIHETRQHTRKVQETLARGKDRLLEINSFRSAPARTLIRKIEAEDNDPTLERFLLSLFDFFDVSHDEFMPRTHLVTFDMAHPSFPVPPLKRGGMAVTFDRPTAVTRGELDFITWDHPLVHDTVELLVGTEQGNCSFARCREGKGISLLLEAVYLLECVAPSHLHPDRFLPATPIRVVMNHSMEEVTDAYLWAEFHKSLVNANASFLKEYPEIKASLLPGMIRACEKIAEKRAAATIKRATSDMNRILGREVDRLMWLKRKNPAVGDAEIALARTALESLGTALSTARVRLDALRLIRVG